MADHILQNLSDYSDYLASLGDTDHSDSSNADAWDATKAQLVAALTMKQKLAVGAGQFTIDYWDDVLVSGNKSIFNWMYGSDFLNFDPNNLNPNDDDLLQGYVDSGGTITDELAPLFCSPLFANPADPQSQGAMLQKALANCQNATPPVQPAALVVSTYAKLGASQTSAAQKAVEAWLFYAAAHGQQTNLALLDAYAALDADHAATKIAGYIKPNVDPTDGSCPRDLMEAYRKLDEAGHPGVNPPSSAAPSTGYPRLQAGFNFGQHTVSGWSYLALTSLLGQQASGQTVDATMLANLDKDDAWAGAYFRWQALQQEQQAGDPLNADYLSSLAGTKPLAATNICEQLLNDQIAQRENLDANALAIVFANDRAAGIDICNRAFDDAYQPLNRLAPGSDSGASAHDSVTTGAPGALGRPVIRVDLWSISAGRPVAGDKVAMYDGTTMVGSRILTVTDVAQGYADVQVGDASPGDSVPQSLGDGVHHITTKYGHADAPGGPTVWSSPGVALPVTISTHAPSMSFVWSDGTNVVYQFAMASLGDAFANVVPTIGDFQVSHFDGSPVDLTNATVTLDCVNNCLQLTCPGMGDVVVKYRPRGTPLQDLAGNTASIPDMGIPAGFSSAPGVPMPTVVSRPSNIGDIPPARILDMGAWNLLNQNDPVNAQQTYAKFKSAGLLPNSFPEHSGLTIDDLVMAAFMERSNNIEQTLRIDVTGLNAKNHEMKNANTLLGDLSKLSPQIPSGTASDKTVASVLKDKFTSLAKDINTDIRNAGLTNIFPTAGGLLDSSVTVGQMQGVIDKLKEVVDNLSTESNSDMLSLQSNTTKRNESVQIVSDLMAKIAALMSELNQNMNR
jgi:hypothetical protein